MPDDNSSVDYGPGRFKGVGFTGGGPVASAWVPCFESGTATLEVHFYDLHNNEILVETYTLVAGGQGAYGLTRTGGNFLDDLPATAVGFKGFARGASVACGQCGSTQPHASGNYLRDGATFPDVIPVGEYLAWCMYPGAHGYSISADAAGGGGGGGLPSGGFQGQQSVTASSVALPNNPVTQDFVLKAFSTNTGLMYWGFGVVTTANGFPLEPGAFAVIAVNNTNAVQIIGTAGQVVAFFGS